MSLTLEAQLGPPGGQGTVFRAKTADGYGHGFAAFDGAAADGAGDLPDGTVDRLPGLVRIRDAAAPGGAHAYA